MLGSDSSPLASRGCLSEHVPWGTLGQDDERCLQLVITLLESLLECLVNTAPLIRATKKTLMDGWMDGWLD